MKKVRIWLQVVLFLAIVAAAVVIFILPILGDTAPGGPKLSFGGGETCQLGGPLEEFNAAGFYMSEDIQTHSFSGHTAQDNFSVFLDAGRSQSCGSGQLVNKGDGYRSGRECMVYSFELRLEDGGRMTCNGVETLGSTREAINAGLGKPGETGNSYGEYDRYSYSKQGRDYIFRFYYDESGICVRTTAAQADPKLSFQSF